MLDTRLEVLKHQSHSDSFDQKLRLQARKLAYPFKQGSLRRLEDSVLKINEILSTALQAAGLDVSGAQLETLSLLATKSENTAHNVSSVIDSVSTLNSDLKSVKSMLSRNNDRTICLSSMIEQSVPKIRDEISTAIPQIQSALPRIELSVAKAASSNLDIAQILTVMSGDIERVEENLNASRETQDQRMRLMQEFLSNLHQSQSQQLARIGSLEKEMRGQRLPLLPSFYAPPGISDDFDWQQSANSSIAYRKKYKRRSSPVQTGTRDLGLSLCICPANYAFKHYQCLSRAISLFYSNERYETHLPQCPFYTSPQQIRKLGARFHSVGYLLSTAILATVSMKTGASSFSITPHLSFKAIVPSSSPAFALFSWKNYVRSATISEILDSIMPRLLRLFAERQASPTDVNELGQSLLHVALMFMIRGLELDLRTLHSLHQLLLSLFASGVPADTCDMTGRSILDTWIHVLSWTNLGSDSTSASMSITSELVDHGAEILTSVGQSWLYHKGSYMISSFLRLYDFAETCRCGPLSMALIRRSEKDVRRILAKVPSALTERNAVGQTPLHISCGWPLGIKLLLDAGAQDIIDCTDNIGPRYPAFVYASEFSCLESLELLLEAECSFFPLCSIGGQNRYSCSFDFALLSGSQDAGSRLIQSLTDRRERLKALALDNLPFEETAKFNLCSNTILDEKSYDIYAALQANAVNVPESLAVPSARISVYHMYFLSPGLAEEMYKRGFHDIDAYDGHGLTPLMSHHSTDLCLEFWLLSHGADLHATPNVLRRSNMNLDATAAHYLGAKIAHQFISYDLDSRCSKLDSKVHDLANLLCSIFEPDICLCGCSSRGCHPATMMFKEFVWRLDMDGSIKHLSWIGQIMRQTSLIDDAPCWLPGEAIRVFTFDALSIRHTCCRYDGLWICLREEEEREELREEDRFRLQLLEELVAEFEEKYTELEVGLVEFFEGYWLTRMTAVLYEGATLTDRDEEEVRRIEAIGVILDREGV
ncbi:hypothetical protein EPUS_08547 [Endocarpon pusillum Z07020]|uniref:Fungal N-terminal domain-containing protein n=1 Tax=Endocarpon pusillum (strain Z07020 / HMAS-L-300199) TaxID=1263415 RepID=U1HVL0_ENDPU|nr:uncharacterized protein EPUS_08547 [Endocarpon pusillum Z07020]ERF73404.1 hypothetical protein EPUS_08547 [Endocarpon pusillum Z07020]